MIVGVLLAAGSASRFGGTQKLVAMLDHQPVVRRSAEVLLASTVEEVVVVVGSDAERVRRALAGLPVTFALSERFADGMSASLRVGIESALSAGEALGRGVEAIVVALGDQPTVGPEVAPMLIERFRRATADGVRAEIVAARYEGERSHPVLFARSVFPELLAVTGDRGAREIIARDAARVAYVDVAGPAPTDVDTPADLERLRREG